MTIPTPAGPIVLADSIRDLSAHRYMLFNQAWAREVGVGSDMYAPEGHLARISLFLSQGNVAAARDEHNHTIMAFTNLTKPVAANYRAAVLAPLVVSIAGVAHADTSEAGLLATAQAVLATGITQAQLVQAGDDSKKNFKPSYA